MDPPTNSARSVRFDHRERAKEASDDLAALFVISTYANVVFTFIKALFNVRAIGIEQGNAAHNILGMLLNIFVVLPSMVAVILLVVAVFAKPKLL